jgi:hypothetical protein
VIDYGLRILFRRILSILAKVKRSKAMIKISKIVFYILVALVCFVSTQSDAQTVSHGLEITSGIAHTSGGIGGGGIGDLPVSGSFILNIDNITNAVSLRDIDITVNPSPLDLNWNDLTGFLSGTFIYLSAPNPSPSFPDTVFQGTFDGNSLHLEGTYYEPCFDCYQYDFVIDAITVSTCFVNEDCPNTADYCQKATGDCEGQGICQPLPGACILIVDPVCGCDGITYTSPCDAAFAGVSIGHEGSCCTDADGDGYAAEGGSCGPIDCDDNDRTVHPGADDSACNGVDNDCDGSVDEDYVSTPSACGTGICESTGEIICDNGTHVDTCTPGTPEADREKGKTCKDGLDNDCDGLADKADQDCGGGGDIGGAEGKGKTCADTVDNDDDGLIDCDDPDCAKNKSCR